MLNNKTNNMINKKLKINMKDWRIITALAVGIGLIIFYFNLFFFLTQPQLFAILNLVAILIALGIPIYTRYKVFSNIKEIEREFPAWIRDLTESIESGMTLPQAIKTTASVDYGKLSSYVKELSAKIEWGIPFNRALNTFANKTGSKVIKRTVKGVIQAHDSGGTVATVLAAITNSVQEIERIKKDRNIRIYSQMVTGYSIFFLFLGIMLVLSKILIPTLSSTAAGRELQDIQGFYDNIFRSLVVIQGIFAGLGIGKMSEGTIVAGLKHSFVLSVVGYTAFILI